MHPVGSVSLETLTATAVETDVPLRCYDDMPQETGTDWTAIWTGSGHGGEATSLAPGRWVRDGFGSWAGRTGRPPDMPGEEGEVQASTERRCGPELAHRKEEGGCWGHRPFPLAVLPALPGAATKKGLRRPARVCWQQLRTRSIARKSPPDLPSGHRRRSYPTAAKPSKSDPAWALGSAWCHISVGLSTYNPL